METTLPYIKAFLSLVFVLALIGLITALLKKYGPEKFQFRASKNKANDRRLKISEMLTLDNKRRLLLIKRDDVEHLVLLSNERDILIESGITKKETKKK